jgi:hypothetical protein
VPDGSTTLAISKGTLESRLTRCSCNFSGFKSQNRVIDQQRERKKEKKSARPGNPEALFSRTESRALSFTCRAVFLENNSMSNFMSGEESHVFAASPCA